ncbi:histidine kinase [Cytophagales bacterium WSM2-2]|nr:histidine kinase [Cytophagales bacterium WSM2-2]
MANQIEHFVYRLFENKVFKWSCVYVFIVLIETIVHQEAIGLSLYTNLFNVAVAVINIEYLIPRWLSKKRFVAYLVLIILLITLFSSGKLTYWGTVSGYQKIFLSHTFVLSTTIFLTVATMMVHLVNEWHIAQRKAALAGKELLSNNLTILRTQLNPHFFFNSINNIYHLIDHNTEEAKTAILKMSELLRFQLDECQADTIALSREVDFIKNYIAFESLKAREEIVVSFDDTISMKNAISIPPLLFLPFVENAFKHISHNSDASSNRIEIRIEATNDVINFTCRNTFDKVKPANKVVSGIGLKNVQSRLDLIYGSASMLRITEEAPWYNVNLQLPCQTQQ